MTRKIEGRYDGIDLVRTVAIICVIMIHAIGYTGILEQDMYTWKWSFFVVLRFVGMCGVPLFLLLTGYLQKDRKPNKAHYKKIIPILITYGIIAVISLVAKSIAGQHIGVIEGICQIFNFTANDYAWYVEMYIGLFLMIPFLNILYKGIPDKRLKLLFIGILVLNTLVPEAVESFGYRENFPDIMPDYWTPLYPITYYFIGVFIADWQPQLHRVTKIALCSITPLIPASLLIIQSALTGEYAWWVSTHVTSLFIGMIAISLFISLHTMKWRVGAMRKLCRSIAMCSFEMYLFSYIIDKLLYHIVDYPIFVMIGIVTLVAYGASKVLQWVLQKLCSIGNCTRK